MKKSWSGIVAALFAASSASAVTVGDQAPEFSAPSTAGTETSLKEFAGSWLVLYFYPKSFTPGCTKEACSLRDGFGEIQALGAKILGVSNDSIETQKRFKEEHKLPFELLADDGSKVAKAYDAAMVGGLMAKRVTFIINPEGKVARVIDSVDTTDHDAQVVDALNELTKI